MNEPIEQLFIKKCRTDPYLAYPQFDRYLTGGQLKIINCLLRFGASGGNAFPSNERIAWETGMKQDSVRVIKSELGKLGVISKQIIKRGSQTIWLYTVDTAWKREQYVSEFDAHFNNCSTEAKPLETAPRESATKAEKPTAKVEKYGDDFIVEDKPDVKDKNSYRVKIKKLLNSGKFEGLQEYKEKYKNKLIIKETASYLKRTNAQIEMYGNKCKFDGFVEWDDEQEKYIGYFDGYSAIIAPEIIKFVLEKIGKLNE